MLLPHSPLDVVWHNAKNRWRSVDGQNNHIETFFVHSIIVCNESNTQFWHPWLGRYVLSFASRSFVTSQVLINCYLRYLREKCRGPITVLRFRPVIDGMEIISLVFGKYSSTSSLFLIKLLLIDFHDVPQAISNISTMCTRSVRWVVQLDTWMNTAWQLSFRSISHANWPLLLWHVWHHSLKFCYHISSQILLLLCYSTVTYRIKSNMMAVLQPDVDFRTFTWCVWPLYMQRPIIMCHNSVPEIKQKLTGSKIGKQLAFHREQTSKSTVYISVLPQTQEPPPSLRRNPISIW